MEDDDKREDEDKRKDEDKSGRCARNKIKRNICLLT